MAAIFKFIILFKNFKNCVLVNQQVLKLHTYINLFNKKNHTEDIVKITITILALSKLTQFIAHLNCVLLKLRILIPWACIINW